MKGVLYNETRRGSSKVKEARESAVDFINYLREKNMPFIVGTNVTSEMIEDIVTDLNELGFGLSLEEVTSSVELSVNYLKSKCIDSIFLISDNEKLREYYMSYGIDVVDYGSKAVVVALDNNLEQRTISQAIEEIKNGAQLIALHRNLTRIDEYGNNQPNVGQLVKFLEEESGYQETATIGKPSETFYLEAMKKLPSQYPSVTLMVGDDPVGDLSGAYKLGMKTAFVHSLNCSSFPNDLGFKPNYEVNCLGEIIGKI